jgi:hypothetical protein
MGRRRVTYGLLAMLTIAALTAAMPASALSTADSFGVNDAMGNPGTVVSVPVVIENAQNGPIITVIFEIRYDTSVITFNSTQKGDLIPTWAPPTFFTPPGGNTTRITIDYDAPNTEHGIQNGSSGSVALINFNVVGAGGSSSEMTLIDIQFSDPSYQVGTAMPKNGVFRVDAGAPIVINQSANPVSIQANGVQETQLNVTAYDDIKIHLVVVNLSQLGGPASQVMTMINDTLFSTTTNASSGTAPGTYYLPINATDLLGNANISQSFALTITAPPTGTVTGALTYSCNGTGVSGVTVNLTQNGGVVDSTTTNGAGAYTFSDVNPGNYYVNATKTRFWENSTAVTVTGGGTATANMVLWLKGDLNNNCMQADAADLAMMKDASVGKIQADKKFDLNNNGLNADAADLAMMKDASVGKIQLL